MEAEELFNDNINLGYKFATRFYLNNQYEKEDAIQISLLGLWKACKTYDPSKGIALSTYAYRIMQNEFNILDRKYDRKLRDNNIRLISIDCSVNEDSDDRELIELIPDYRSSEDSIINQINCKEIINNISNLNDKELKVFELMQQGYTQSKISKILGCSQPQISRIYRSSINKIKNWIN